MDIKSNKSSYDISNTDFFLRNKNMLKQIFDINILPVKCYEWIQITVCKPWDPVAGSSEFTLAAVCDCDTAVKPLANILPVLSVLILTLKCQFF